MARLCRKFADLNPFKEKQQPLPGRRVPVIETTESISANLADADKPIVLPALTANEAWPQPGGEPNNVPGNLALDGALHQMWTASAGEGSSKTGRVTASPIVYGGRIYALDAAANVTAFSLSGSKVFSVSTKPEGDIGQGGYGGGLAAENGRLYVANGYGVVTALDPQSGKAIWSKTLGVPVRASPTAVGDRLYVITIDGRFYALSGIDGTEAWSARGLPQTASLMTSTSPAVGVDVVVVPYPSGDIMAFKLSDGSTAWSESLSRTRQTSQIASMSDAARPAIDDGTVFAIGHAGRMVATQAKTGERLWSLTIPGRSRPAWRVIRFTSSIPAAACWRLPVPLARLAGWHSCRIQKPGPAQCLPATCCGSPPAKVRSSASMRQQVKLAIRSTLAPRFIFRRSLRRAACSY